MRLIFVRHGESQNNCSATLKGSDDSEDAYNAKRVPDPTLVPSALDTGALVAAWVSKELLAGREEYPDPIQCRLICSPMIRALQSAQILFDALKGVYDVEVFVDPEVGEVGGLFYGVRQDDGIKSPNNGDSSLVAGLTRQHILEKYPDFVCLPGISEDGWWKKPQESFSKSQKRAREFSERVRKVASFNENLADVPWSCGWKVEPDRRVVLVVAHGLFFSLTSQALLLGDSMIGIERCQIMLNNWAVTQFQLKEEAGGAQRRLTALDFHNLQAFIPQELRRKQHWRGLHGPHC